MFIAKQLESLLEEKSGGDEGKVADINFTVRLITLESRLIWSVIHCLVDHIRSLLKNYSHA